MSAPSQTKLNVLIADDDPIFRSLVESRLQHFDCTLHSAADGGEAWRVTRSHLLDLALVDFDMPGLDGIALTRCLRSHPQTRHIPIVMCTSRTDGASMLAALEAGVSSFMTKPVNWSLFERHIRHLLHMSEASAKSAAALATFTWGNAEKDAVFSRLTAAVLPLLQRVSRDPQLGPLAVEAHTQIMAYEQAAAGLRDIGRAETDSVARSA